MWLIEKKYQWLEKAGIRDSRGTDHGSTRTDLEPKIDRGRESTPDRTHPPETEQHVTTGWAMQAGKAYLERHNQAGIVYRNICSEYGLELPGSKWTTPPKGIGMTKLRSRETSRRRKP